MTRYEAISAFGRPTHEEAADGYGHARLEYQAPAKLCKLPKEGYCGFVLVLTGDKVTDYIPIIGTPSLAESEKTP
jgi:hypothetical protein